MSTPNTVTPEVHVGDELDGNEQGETGEQRWERPAHLGSRASRRAHVESAEDLNDGGATDAAMASIVEYELIPMLKEYWFDEPGKVREWSDRLRRSLR